MKITEIQDSMKQIYFEKDQQRGLEKTLLWLVSEVGELADLVAKNSNLAEIKIELSNEVADCFAWLLSVSNLLEIDLERAILNKYPFHCPRCSNNPCTCVDRLKL